MSGKLVYLVSFVLVLGAAWASPVMAADPNLVGWWKFDGNGLDASGNGRNGTLSGDAHFEAGHLGQALSLDGNGDYFTVTGWKGLLSVYPVTVSAWVKTTGNGTMVYWGRNAGTRRVDFRLDGGRLRVEHGSGNIQANTILNDNEWHHIALAMRAAAVISYPEVKLYLDGRDDTQHSTDPEGDKFALVDNASNVDLTIGRRTPQNDRLFLGLIDEVQIYNKELVAGQIKDLAKLGYLARAYSPNPSDGQKFEDSWVNLTWAPGPLAASHDVYFSTSFQDVNTGVPAAFVGNMTTNSQPVGFPGFPAPEGLAPGTTYYWRVDAINTTNPASPWRGDVWSFWIPQLTAYNPDPGDGEPAEATNVVLSWSPGLKSIMAAVYFGTDKDQVANATGAPPAVGTTYNPGPLTASTTYYWRVDTFNGSTWLKGVVWTFKTRPDIPVIADPNFIGWWKLDEGAGTTALDWTGHNNTGSAYGGPQWVEGYEGTALLFDGADSYINIDGYKGILGTRARTITAWVNTTSTTTGVIAGWGFNTANQRMELRIDVGRLRSEHEGGNVQGGTYLADGGWHHVAVTVRSGATISYPDVKIYLDGVDDTIPTVDPDPFDTVAGFDARIGSRPSKNDRFFTGIIDDVRIYNKELTPQEIELVMRTDLLRAWKPSPRDGATLDIEHVGPLTWTKGDKATQHEIYFGTNRASVADATAADKAGVYRGRQSATSYTPTADLAWGGGPYFWRVDEINNDGTVTKGKIWSFRVSDFLVVDDVESYNDFDPPVASSHRIFDAWSDGFATPATNGALVGNALPPYTERANVHSGGQAMPLSYDNNLKSSEATLTLAAGRDWTRQGVTELSLWFRGVATNGAEKMYVAINGTAVVYHTNANVAQTATWTEWVIPLQQFATLGVNLNNVTSVTIGFGTRGNTTVAGGKGQMYFDDIRLYKPRTTP